MLRRRFGRTEIQMPVLSCGGMRYQQAWQDVPTDKIETANQSNLEATIRRAVELGINHIETARGYGSSERQLGRILPTFPRHEIIVQTKIGPEKDPAQFRANFMESLERLRLAHVDLLAIHGINNDETAEWSLRSGGCLAVCRELQKQGLARHIGFSTHGPVDVLMNAVRHERDGGFDYINLHWYYIFQKNWPVIAEATRRDMGVFIISPSDKGGMLYNPTPELRAATAPLHPIVFNDLFCLRRPEIHTLSIGAARPTDFDLHVEAVGLYDRLHEILPPIEARLAETMRAAAGVDHPEGHETGLPPWHQTPRHINIPVILWLRNLVKAWGMVEYAKMRYNLLGNGGHWFPGLNAAHVDERELAPLLKDSPWRDRIPAMLREAHELLAGQTVQRLSKSE